MEPTHKKKGTKQRLVKAMGKLLQCKGFHGTGINDVLVLAQAPKGVLYHHFPGGKVELAVAAIEEAVCDISRRLELLQTEGHAPVQSLGIWMDQALKCLSTSRFEKGCPLATAALESTAADGELRTALDNGFRSIRAQLTRILVDGGMTEEKAGNFAFLLVSTFEGALLQSRVAMNSEPADISLRFVLRLVQGEVDPRDRA